MIYWVSWKLNWDYIECYIYLLKEVNINEKRLTSSMTIDDAYLLVTGMSYNQFKEYEKTEIERMKKRRDERVKLGEYLRI